MLFGTHTHRTLPVSRLKNITCGFLLFWFFLLNAGEGNSKKMYFVFVRVQITYGTIVLTLKDTLKWHIMAETKTVAFC